MRPTPRMVLFVSILFALTGSSRATPPDPTEQRGVLERLGSWPYGQALAVASDDARDLVFLGSGGAVLVLDVSDLAQPQIVADAMHTLGLVEDICYDAATQRVFLACGEGGLEIWDLQNPAAPVQLTVFEVLYYGYDTPVQHVEVWGNYAIVDCAWGFVRSIDVSDPANPFQVSVADDMGQSNDIYLSKDDSAVESPVPVEHHLSRTPAGNHAHEPRPMCRRALSVA